MRTLDSDKKETEEFTMSRHLKLSVILRDEFEVFSWFRLPRGIGQKWLVLFVYSRFGKKLDI